MCRKKWIILLLIFPQFYIQCQKNELENQPLIRLFEEENRRFVYTNKHSGYFIANSHSPNHENNEGWYVNKYPYLKDYRLYLNSNILPRDSVDEFLYYPSYLTRKYSDKITETFTMLDSLNALLWEFEFTGDDNDIIFEPLFHKNNQNTKFRLSAEHTQIILSPPQIYHESDIYDSLSLGLKLFWEHSDKAVVLCVLERCEAQVNRLLSWLQENYKNPKSKRLNRISSLISHNQLVTNIPEISDAVTWAQISLDALVTSWGEKGIWAGLPNNDSYRGRDSFISLSSAFLITGKFQEASSILRTFAKLQLTNEEDTWFGRIPNTKTHIDLTYNTADVTWWFIRSVYEYYLYTADLEFVQEVFPVIKRAILGALRYRVDKNFFLVHNDDETWMAEDSPVPRGNRAVEIQALWYTALLIGSQLAWIDREYNLSEYWLAIAETLRQNFIDQFWNSFNYHMYDHIKKDDVRDKKIRPNQILTVTVPELPRIVPLISHEIRGRVTEQVVRSLTYHYGVASLWQEDDDFHPLLMQPKDTDYYNGLIWPWLAGPVISAMLQMHHEELAFQLFYYEAKQILEWDAIGNQCNVFEAPIRSEYAPPRIVNQVSQAWSLATFVANFYHDFIGYQPDAANSVIIFKPNVPQELNYISAILPFKNTSIIFKYHYNQKEGIFSFEISLCSAESVREIVFNLPGFERIQITVDRDIASYSFEFFEQERRLYKAYPNLDWHFVQPKIEQY